MFSILRRFRTAWYFEPGPGAVWLASFPRSGNTWLRAIFGALTIRRKVRSIAELDRIVPEEDVPVARWRLVNGRHTFIKTHVPYLAQRTDFQQARGLIYVVRDPRDVILSHYQYLTHLYDLHVPIDEFCKDWLSGRIFPGSWYHHVRSWTDDGPSRASHLHVVRYEDLRSNCTAEIGRLCRALGLGFKSEEIADAVAQASIEEMKTKERAGMRPREQASGFTFINQGAVDGWQTRLAPNVAARIAQECAATMDRFNYLDPSTGP